MSTDMPMSYAHHPGHEIVMLTCANKVNPGHEAGHGSTKILDQGPELRK
jgi:hypothetical protein